MKKSLLKYLNFIWEITACSENTFKEDLHEQSLLFMCIQVYLQIIIHLALLGFITFISLCILYCFIEFTMCSIISACLFLTPALVLWVLKQKDGQNDN